MCRLYVAPEEIVMHWFFMELYFNSQQVVKTPEIVHMDLTVKNQNSVKHFPMGENQEFGTTGKIYAQGIFRSKLIGQKLVCFSVLVCWEVL